MYTSIRVFSSLSYVKFQQVLNYREMHNSLLNIMYQISLVMICDNPGEHDFQR